jgi:hypothetical protein
LYPSKIDVNSGEVLPNTLAGILLNTDMNQDSIHDRYGVYLICGSIHHFSRLLK